MEVIAGFGGASALMAIALEAGKMGKWLYRCGKTMYFAREDVQKMGRELSVYSRILHLLDETMDSARSTDLLTGRASAQGLVQDLTDQGCSLLKDFGRFRKKLKSLRDDQSSSFVSRTVARFQWLRSKSGTAILMLKLDSHKLTLNLLISTIMLGEKVEEAKRCEERGERVPEKLRMMIQNLRQDLKREKRECTKVKAELARLQRLQPGMVDIPNSAERFIQTVLRLATQQQVVERRQREQRGSEVSSGLNRTPQQSRLSSISGANAVHSNHVEGTEAGMESFRLRQTSGPRLTTRDVSPLDPARDFYPPAPTRDVSPPASPQRQRPAGSVPTALVGDLPVHQRYQRPPPTVGPVVHDDGYRIHVLERQWRTSPSSRGSVGGNSGYDSNGYDSVRTSSSDASSLGDSQNVV